MAPRGSMNKCEYCDLNLHKYKDEFVSVWNTAHMRIYYHIECWVKEKQSEKQK